MRKPVGQFLKSHKSLLSRGLNGNGDGDCQVAGVGKFLKSTWKRQVDLVRQPWKRQGMSRKRNDATAIEIAACAATTPAVTAQDSVVSALKPALATSVALD